MKCDIAWLSHKDHHGVTISEWCCAHTSTTVKCLYDGAEIDFSTQGLHALIQHSKTKKHMCVHASKTSSDNMKLISVAPGVKSKNTSSSSSFFLKPGSSMSLGLPLKDRITNAEIYWALKVASADFSLRSCDNICELFRAMFDCDVTKSNDFSFGRSKASYVISDGLGPHLLKMLIADVKKCESGFTIMYETTNAKNDKRMDILIRYWSETTGQVETKYLTSLMFARATAEKLQEMLMGLQNDEVLSDLPWEKFCNVSSDGPHINKKLWRLINSELLKEGKHGLMPLLVCNIHIIQNGFKKGIDAYGQL